MAELLVLGPDTVKLEMGLYCREPGDRCILTKWWQLQVSHVVQLVEEVEGTVAAPPCKNCPLHC